MKTIDDTTLRDLCKQAVAKTASIDDAVKSVIKMLDGHPSIKANLVAEMLTMAVRETVYDVRGMVRAACKSAASPMARGTDGLLATSRVLTRAFLDTWMVGDKTLGDLRGDELLPVADEERQMAFGHTRNARFYEALAQLTPNDALVRDHVTDEKAMELCQKAAVEAGQIGIETQKQTTRSTRRKTSVK